VRLAAPRLTEVSAERVRDEIYAIFGSPDAMRAVKIMDRTGALSAVFPELDAARGVEQPPNHHYWDVFEHCVQTVGMADAILDGDRRQTSVDLTPLPWRDDFDAYFDETVGDGQKRSTLLRLAALLHDIAKPETKSLDEDGRTRFFGHGERGAEVVREVLERLRCSRGVIEHVSVMVREHLRPFQISSEWGKPTRRAVFRYYRDLGSTATDTVFLSLSDYLAARGPYLEVEDWQGCCRVADVILNPAFDPEDSKASLLLNGNELQRHFGLRPGPIVGHLLGLLREAEATGRIQTREEAMEMLRSEISRSESNRGRTD
jgi:putative nucleotidyltransferase with HDIG domain